MDQNASVGRIVHFHVAQELPAADFGTVILPSAPRAALVTRVGELGTSNLNLWVFDPDGGDGVPHLGVEFSLDPKPGHWTWPPRV